MREILLNSFSTKATGMRPVQCRLGFGGITVLSSIYASTPHPKLSFPQRFSFFCLQKKSLSGLRTGKKNILFNRGFLRSTGKRVTFIVNFMYVASILPRLESGAEDPVVRII